MTSLALLLPLALIPQGDAKSQDTPPPAPAPGSREATWPAPTAEDWAKPVQITWQRTWEDALAVSKETGKPIMVAINMDGEIASEHYAGVRYRDPEVGKLFEPYVSVVASVYRHNPRDYDENGNRIPCPRFGCVTCGEHMAMEPAVYDQFLDKTRVAPRHIMVELDGAETYDIFYALDVTSVLEGIREGIENRESTELPENEKDLGGLIASRAQGDRVYVEEVFRKAKRADRLQMLDLAGRLGKDAPIDMLRLALFGLDVETARAARVALAQLRSEAAVELILEVLAVPLPADERTMLLDALEAIGEGGVARAKTLARTLRGLEGDGGEQRLRVEALGRALSGVEASEALRARYEVEAELSGLEAAKGLPAEEQALAATRRAEGLLRLAVEPDALDFRGPNGAARRRRSALMFTDVADAAREAEAIAGRTWRTAAALGLASWYRGEPEAARPLLAEAFDGMAADASPGGTRVAQGFIGVAVASLRAKDLREAVYGPGRRGEEPAPGAIQAADAAHDLLRSHPLSDDLHAREHHDLLLYIGARRRAFEVLEHGLARFPASDALHRRLRDTLLWRRGVKAMLAHYAATKERIGADAATFWFAGLAELVAAEHHRRRARQGEAIAAYDTAQASFTRVAELDEQYGESCKHYRAIALAGQGHAAMELGELERAAALLTRAMELYPNASNVLDGLNFSAVTTSKLLGAKLAAANLVDAREALEAAVARLDARLLEKPAFEIPPDTEAARGRDRRGRKR